MASNHVWLEAVRLLAQLVGALVVARVAVHWALKRYKSEKTWERRLASYVESVAAISEMRLVAGQWIDQIESTVIASAEKESESRDRYRNAKRRLDEATATASLLLPPSTSELLTKLDREIERTAVFKDTHTFLNQQYSLLDDALANLISLGKQDLR